MPLYLVRSEVESVVYVPTEKDAQNVASRNFDDVFDTFSLRPEDIVVKLLGNRLPDGWDDGCLPYCAKGADDRTIAEIRKLEPAP